MSELKSRSAKNAAFLIKEGLKQLRHHASKMADDPASIERVIREADLLSTTCKKLATFAETAPPSETAQPTKPTGPKFDIRAVTRLTRAVNRAVDGRDGVCPVCCGLITK